MQSEKSSEEETAVPAVCCDNGFLKDDDQQEDDCQKKLVVKDKKSLSYETTFVDRKVATDDSTRFMTDFIRGLGWQCLNFKFDHESASLALKKRVVKSSQDMEMVPVPLWSYQWKVTPTMVMPMRR